MAFSASTRHLLLLVSTLIYIFFSTCKFGRAYDDPHLGAAGVVANEYVPQAEAEGAVGAEGAEGAEGETDDEYHSQPGAVGTNPGPVFTKALECFNDKYIYSSCDEAYRLTQKGELNVPHEYTDEYCTGPCLRETHLVLQCIDEVLKHFVFYNKATVEDVRETIKTGCSYGPKRGEFNVAEHIQFDEAIASKKCTSSVHALVLMIMGWHVLF